jgi:hypothetical protein
MRNGRLIQTPVAVRDRSDCGDRTCPEKMRPFETRWDITLPPTFVVSEATLFFQKQPFALRCHLARF